MWRVQTHEAILEEDCRFCRARTPTQVTGKLSCLQVLGLQAVLVEDMHQRRSWRPHGGQGRKK